MLGPMELEPEPVPILDPVLYPVPDPELDPKADPEHELQLEPHPVDAVDVFITGLLLMICYNFLYVTLTLMKRDESLGGSFTSCCFDHSFSPAKHPRVYSKSNNPKFGLQLSNDLNILNC
jgi:hypothetical protein